MKAARTSRDNPYHPDVALFLLLIPFISAFNYYLTYSNIRLSWFLVVTFTLDTVQGYIAWWAVRKLIFYLDRRLPFQQSLLKRIIIQLITTMALGMLIIILLTELTAWIARGRPAALNFYTTDVFIISIWFFVINGIYIGFFFYNQWKTLEAERRDEKRERADGLVLKQGKQDLILTFETVAGFLVETEYVVAIQLTGKKFVVDQSLDKLEKTLPSVFFRVNRQYILHRQVIRGFRRIENGKLEILLNAEGPFPAEITVLRTKASAFKCWFQPEA